jgi:hypothetical protein
MAMEKLKRCTRCVLPETVGGITFDENGVCSFCRNFQRPETLAKKALDEIIASARTDSDKYDCVVPLSGGRDSSYVLYLAKAIYGLKTLAVTYDNEFKTDQSVVNMETACEKLDVDLVSVRSKRDVVRKIVQCGLLSSVPRKLFRVCRACTYGFKSAVYRKAEELKVPLILWGDSAPEALGRVGINACRASHLTKSRPLFFLNPAYWKSKYYFLLQKLEFPVSGNSLSAKFPVLKNDDIEEIHVFDYIPWDRRKIKETIMGRLGWKKPPDSVSTWRSDCKLTLVVNYCFLKMHGCSKACFGYCKMINCGLMERQEALKQEEMFTEIADGRQMRKLLEDEIGLSRSQADKVLSA